jgi:hypothetical protein
MRTHEDKQGNYWLDTFFNIFKNKKKPMRQAHGFRVDKYFHHPKNFFNPAHLIGLSGFASSTISGSADFSGTHLLFCN